MSADQDRVLAQLSVDTGLLTRDEATHYWRRAQTPGSPRFVQLLVAEGRLSPPQLEQLKARFYAVQQGLDAAGGASSPQGGDSFVEAGRAAAYENVPTQGVEATLATFLGGMGAKVPGAPGGPDPWEEALHKDMLLAQALLQQGATSHDRLRECRDLQLHHQMRLGVILVKKGYVDRATVEAAIAHVRTRMSPSEMGRAVQFQNASTHLEAQANVDEDPFELNDPDEQSTVLDGGERRGGKPPRQDGIDTVLNTPSGGVNLLGVPTSKRAGYDPFDTGPATGLSVEELNPFAGVPLDTGSKSWAADLPNAGPVGSHTDIPMPDSGGEHFPAPPPPGGPPVVDMAPASMGSRPTSGFTPTGVPIGGEADSGSTKMKAREKAQLQRVQHKKQGRRKQSNFPLLLILMLGGGVAIAVGVYFLIAELGP